MVAEKSWLQTLMVIYFGFLKTLVKSQYHSLNFFYFFSFFSDLSYKSEVGESLDHPSHKCFGVARNTRQLNGYNEVTRFYRVGSYIRVTILEQIVLVI